MAKVKVKTHSGAKKRFKITGTGKVKYQHTNKRQKKMFILQNRQREYWHTLQRIVLVWV